eukprot:scaffold8517_cov51-Phaeocystis_antarctica.AAC.2
MPRPLESEPWTTELRCSSRLKAPPWRCPSSPPAHPQGAPGGSGQLGTLPGSAQSPCPVTASGARVSRPQGRPSHRL